MDQIVDQFQLNWLDQYHLLHDTTCFRRAASALTGMHILSFSMLVDRLIVPNSCDLLPFVVPSAKPSIQNLIAICPFR